MTDTSIEILNAIYEIRDLIRLMAEPAIAERDKKIRAELRRITGKSPAKAKAVMLMDGIRTQANIVRESGVDKGYLSTLVKQLKGANLLLGDPKKPKIAISLPSNFFDGDGNE